MTSRTTTHLSRGQIATLEGADTLRAELLSAHIVRCGDLWMVSASIYSDGAAEIELSCNFDQNRQQWSFSAFYYSFDRATAALRDYEADGTLPEGE